MSGLTNPVHLAFIAVIALVVLGPKRLPDLAKTLGNGLREFRDAISVDGSRSPSEPAPAVEMESTYPVAPAAAEATPQPAAAPALAEQELAATAYVAPTPAEQELAGPSPPA